MTGAKGTARDLLAEAAGCEAAAVPADAAIGRFDRWDSLVHMRLVLAIEAHLGRELDPEAVLSIESLDDVAALLVTR